jgi:hypothetical protein
MGWDGDGDNVQVQVQVWSVAGKRGEARRGNFMLVSQAAPEAKAKEKINEERGQAGLRPKRAKNNGGRMANS